ncbi:Phenylacetate-coenzyme A ligase [Posidoniimonas corsicana]|uniref:Phenylacetate-coenzyme A ligase n=2 Tax=Posidoniimonas corsicana TaxID=1938618 RepID=A0A5C5V675_9BACT|nr:Phenylacetate-coenzyme A ligase [Posidoniimonas corsicana]
MICVHDFAKRDAIRAANIVTLRASGYRLGMRMVEIPPDICDVVCGEQGERDEGVLRHLLGILRYNRWRDANTYRDLRGLVERNWVYNRKTYPPFGAGGSHPGTARLDYYIDRLQRDRPFLLKGLTTYLYQIAQRVLERGRIDLEIPVIKPLGSGATPHMRETLETAFGGRFWDDYGSAELGSVAFSCGDSDGMHVLEDLFIVEVLDSQGAPTPPGEVGEVVVTDLANHAMPLIRYRVGDLGRLLEGECQCGRLSRRLRVEGRLQDALRDSQGNWVTSNEIAEHIYRLPWVDQFQLVERREDLLEITVVIRQGLRPDEGQLSSYFRDRLGREVRLRIRTARSISPEPGGKFRWVKALPAKPLTTAGAVNAG